MTTTETTTTDLAVVTAPEAAPVKKPVKSRGRGSKAAQAAEAQAAEAERLAAEAKAKAKAEEAKAALDGHALALGHTWAGLEATGADVLQRLLVEVGIPALDWGESLIASDPDGWARVRKDTLAAALADCKARGVEPPAQLIAPRIANILKYAAIARLLGMESDMPQFRRLQAATTGVECKDGVWSFKEGVKGRASVREAVEAVVKDASGAHKEALKTALGKSSKPAVTGGGVPDEEGEARVPSPMEVAQAMHVALTGSVKPLETAKLFGMAVANDTESDQWLDVIEALLEPIVAVLAVPKGDEDVPCHARRQSIMGQIVGSFMDSK